jgi:hypothetical protein
VTRTTLAALALLLTATAELHAQIIQPVYRSRPVAWASLSVGWFQPGDSCGAAESECWDFGGAPQFRATLELPVGNSASFGIAGTMAKVPLIFRTSTLLPGSCNGCDADANVSQILANFRLGGGAGAGFHQVIDLSAGTTLYSNFRSTDGARLGSGTVSDLSFGLGYGFGYSLSPRTQVVLVQEWMLVLHERRPGSSENTSTQSNIRVGGRVALGEK